MFRKYKGINISYNKQGLIYFICKNINDMPYDVQQKILNLCIDIGKEDYKALYSLLTSENKSSVSVSLEYHINEKKINRLRKKFYEKFENVR